MDLTSAVARLAARRPHVLVVEVPGWGPTRMTAERELRHRGWVQANSPAEADIMLTCGVAGREFSEIVDRVWDQLPGPRVRIGATDPDQVSGVLDESRRALLDGTVQRVDAEARTAVAGDVPHDPDHGDAGHGDMDHGDMGHEGMDHDGMDMPMPGGIGLAEGGTDRDGLDLDVLHVSLGPVLPHWPAGLVVRCSLQGDVVTGAAVEVLPAAGWGPDRARDGAGLMRGTVRLRSAQYCDQVAGLLALLDFERLSMRAIRLRDSVLDDAPIETVTAEVERLGERLRRSRVLRWSVQDLPGVLEGLMALLDGVRTALLGEIAADTAAPLRSPAAEAERLEQIPGLITGLDVAGARLVIASLGLDTAVVAPEGSDHG
ncbi:hypothetical protein FQ377_00765 [Arthrobacter echini]|uniref:Uncharacterized protein n=1 Tax=Arthrobacter echini TaxID=1529066 RepID=A0A5D0XUQ9_9MICC|nr:hypothetical protein [Arthrobacter echini]TYD00037.1 hypothetical protein FQ377_00765 [Arthrobacter echini]